MVAGKKNTNEQGFTLVEVMMALVILGIGIFAIVGLQTRNVSLNTGSKKQTEGYTWAMDQVETLLALPYTDANLQPNGGDPTVDDDGYTVIQGPYTVEWDVNDNAAIANSRIINVRVRWNNKDVAQVDYTRISNSF
ncbi:MAG: prepilin-type N-terminal cleavage/methylation domain-containing protein [Desulfuromusa sp.]|nr:prepilin-type N-terminal cleavage/methylation domain-containing protein [Desulfuromusa sp.]